MKSWLGRKVSVRIDRPIGSKYPHFPTVYSLNYGYLPDTFSEVDKEEIDAYVLGPRIPLKEFCGVVIAIVKREDGEIKLVVTDGQDFSVHEIKRQINFQEKFHKYKIIK